MPKIRDMANGKWHRGVAEFVEFIDPVEPNDRYPEGKSAQVKCKVTCTEGEFKGLWLSYWGSLKSGRPREITEKQLKAMGWTGKAIKTGKGIGSKEFVFLVENRPWQDKEYTNIKAVAEPKEFPKDNDAPDVFGKSDDDIPF